MGKSSKAGVRSIILLAGSLAAPVIAGLAVGIGLVVLFATSPVLFAYSSVSLPPSPDPSYYSSLIQLKVTGLKESYHAGERIDFAVTQKAAGCVFPETVIVKHVQTGDVVWQFNSTHANMSLMGCIAYARDPYSAQMTMNTRYEQPIIISQAGSYAVIAQHQHVRVEQQFAVVE